MQSDTLSADPTPSPHESDYVRRPEALGYVKTLQVLRDWDPIGVFEGDHKGPQDEYDSYAASVMRMLDAGKSREEIVEHLGSIATEQIGLSSFDRLHTEFCVLNLIEFWRSWKRWRASPGNRETLLDRVSWHVLGATADDWESIDQIEPHVREYCEGVSDRAEIAARIIELTRIQVLEEMPHKHLERPAESAEDILRQPNEHWFRMTPIGRMLWDINHRNYCDD